MVSTSPWAEEQNVNDVAVFEKQMRRGVPYIIVKQSSAVVDGRWFVARNWKEGKRRNWKEKKRRNWKESNGFYPERGWCVSTTVAANNVHIDMCLPVHFHDGRHVRPGRSQNPSVNWCWTEWYSTQRSHNGSAEDIGPETCPDVWQSLSTPRR